MKEETKINGFTLTELLAVIVILALIALIAYPIVTRLIGNNQKKLYEEQIRRIEAKTKEYVTKIGLTEDAECVSVKDDLQAGGFLEVGKISDPRGTIADLSVGVVHVCWDDGNNQYIYKYSSSCDSLCS